MNPNKLDFAKRSTMSDAIMVGLENELLTTVISSVIPNKELQAGKEYTVPSVNDPMVQKYEFHGSHQGTPITSKGNTITIDETPMAMVSIDKVEMKQLSGELGKKLSKKLMYVVKNYIDQFTISTGVVGAKGDLGTKASLTPEEFPKLFADAQAELDWENGGDGSFALLNPNGVAKIQQALIKEGFNEADRSLRRGFRGMFGGFNVYSTNNLPVEVEFELKANPADAQYFKIGSSTIRIVDTLVKGGDVKRGGTKEITQANIVKFINQSGTEGVDYMDWAEEEFKKRVKLANRQIKITDFTADVAMITGYGRIKGDTTGLTDASNKFNDEYTYYLFGLKEGISSGVQMEPELEDRKPGDNKVTNRLCNALHGAAVLGENAYHLVVVKVPV